MPSESSPLLSIKQPLPHPARRRPPLIAVPSSQSIRSMKCMEPVLEHYDVESIDFDLLNAKTFDRWAYVTYYLPVLRWLPAYKREFLLGDFLAGVSLASFQIPLVMSLATSLAKLPPLVGLYSVVAASLTYAVFGGVPVLVVGPLPSTAVLYGQVVETLIHDASGKYAHLSALDISATLSVGMSAVLLAVGFLRWGFLDNVLSRALLKGFLGAMGFVMIINQLDIQMGLQLLAKHYPHNTILEKIVFACSHWHMAQFETVLLTVVTLAIVLLVRRQKAILVDHYKIKSAIYIPDVLGMVVIATLLSYYFDWESKGIAIVGDLAKAGTSPVNDKTSIFINPFHWSRLSLFKKGFGTSFLCSILGFFDSTTATKALGTKYNYKVSSNRELIALGACNLAISFLGGLPSFGALGRSKVNILAGAITPLATVIMGFTVILAIRYFLPLLYFLPECVLSLSTTIIGITVIEEVPQDVVFFWNISGYDEIVILLIVFCTTMFWSVEAGVILGVIIAVVRVIKHGTQSRIHIMGRIPNTTVFRNADELIEESFASHVTDGSHEGSVAEFVAEIEQIEGVLIIKIPEPLNFANMGDLKHKLGRIERFGTLLVHPSQPSSSGFDEGAVKSVIFDCKGMTAIDLSATQELYETVRRYSEKNGICVSFSRVPMQKQVRARFIELGLKSVVNANYERFHRVRSTTSLPDFAAQPTSANLGKGFFLSIDEALRFLGTEGV